VLRSWLKLVLTLKPLARHEADAKATVAGLSAATRSLRFRGAQKASGHTTPIDCAAGSKRQGLANLQPIFAHLQLTVS